MSLKNIMFQLQKTTFIIISFLLNKNKEALTFLFRNICKCSTTILENFKKLSTQNSGEC